MIRTTKEFLDSIGDISILFLALPISFVMIAATRFGLQKLRQKCWNTLITLKVKQTPKSSPWLIDNHLITNKLATSVKAFKKAA